MVDLDLQNTAKQARSLLERGRHGEAARLYRVLCADPNTIELAYDDWLRGLARSLAGMQQRQLAAYLYLYLQEFEQALGLLSGTAAEEPLNADRARVLEARGWFGEAAKLYSGEGKLVQAAIAFERAAELCTPPERQWQCGCGTKNTIASVTQLPLCSSCGVPWVDSQSEAFEHYTQARACWERLRGDDRLRALTYEQALVCFNLGTCCLRLGDDAGMAHLVTAQRLLEEAADGFETAGQRERAFDCYQILLELGRRSGAFENLAEGFINCIRILKEDNLKYYVLQYYEDFLREALGRDEYHAAATLYRGAADFCLRSSLIYDRHYMRAAAETWLKAAEHTLTDGGPAEMAENDCLAAVECFNAVGDYEGVGRCYKQLSSLKLSRRAQKRYARIAPRYDGAANVGGDAPPFPEYLRQPHAYPDIWYMDLIEWEHDGDAAAICGAVVGDMRYPDVVRRRGLNLLLQILEGATSSVDNMAQVAERLGDLQIYAVLSGLEKLYETNNAAVQQGVMRAVQYLFFKRSFVVLTKGLSSEDPHVRQAAIDSLGRLYFNHAFDPLVRIFRENDDPRVRRTALRSIGMTRQLQAGDFLLEVLRYEQDPLRSDAKQLLIQFQNNDFFPVLRQHYELETGPARADLEEILRQVKAL